MKKTIIKSHFFDGPHPWNVVLRNFSGSPPNVVLVDEDALGEPRNIYISQEFATFLWPLLKEFAETGAIPEP